MNIKHNRYVVFIVPLICSIVAATYSISWKDYVFTSWFIYNACVDFIDVQHIAIKKWSHRSIEIQRVYMDTQWIIVSLISLLGYSEYSLLGFFCVSNKMVPSKLGFFSFLIWLFIYIWDHSFGVGQSLHYGWILLVISLIDFTLVEEKRKNDAVIQVKLLWSLRFISLYLTHCFKWMVWCSNVFPYILRFDILFFASCIQFLLYILIEYKIKSKHVKYTKRIPELHMPAPTIGLALKCPICKDRCFIDDVEHQAKSFYL